MIEVELSTRELKLGDMIYGGHNGPLLLISIERPTIYLWRLTWLHHSHTFEQSAHEYKWFVYR